MKKQTDFIGFRATEAERKRLNHLSDLTGLGMSELLRSLIHTAEVQPVQSYRVVSVGLQKNNRHDAKVSEAGSVTAVAA